MTISKARDLKIEFLILCQDDSTGLWLIIRITKNILGTKDADEIQKIILHLVLEFLKKQFIVVGFPLRDGTFKRWHGEPKELVEKIKIDWDQLDREPNLGDVIWFYITEKGSAELKRLNDWKKHHEKNLLNVVQKPKSLLSKLKALFLKKSH
ncbi:MAG: hypothetical protein ABIH77_02155 [Pseudomonadota bacterium]|nr:hypothetical protein [Gammaproteobacteria bacterium]MBU1559182.1 hypothetical protein [Gammaproteobacteria bacterium]MBU1629288.1 hypothetical protein [Gammaproteobacteria bacterium]MBU1926899.1 hypothetical protein [Gammaproteobacteria bacterium]MBU2546038.1 hypothetical protein [Gammaproteobacteria bacterium]